MGKKVSFLIVSGNKSRVQRCTDVLSKHFENCTVFHGAEWFEAKYKLDNVHPKAVLIDEHLPKGTGFEIVGKILKDRNNDDIAIVVMTAEKDHEMFASEIAAGRVHFLTKPEDEQALVQCLSKIVTPKPDENQARYDLIRLQPGEVLFKEGDRTELAYIVKQGVLRAYCSGHEGDKINLGEIAAGEFVGEMGHFNQEPRSATVEAVSETELIAIPNKSFENVIFDHPSWAKALVKTLAQRLRKANKAIIGY